MGEERRPELNEVPEELERDISSWNLRHVHPGAKARSTSVGTIFTDEAGRVVRVARRRVDVGPNAEGKHQFAYAVFPTYEQVRGLPGVCSAEPPPEVDLSAAKADSGGPTQREMLFANPTFPPAGSSFTTVRRGEKWAAARPGDSVVLVAKDFSDAPGGGPSGFAEVEEALLVPGGIASIPARLLQLNHEEACRNLEGLAEVLGRCYEGFNVSEPVTVVRLKVAVLATEVPAEGQAGQVAEVPAEANQGQVLGGPGIPG